MNWLLVVLISAGEDFLLIGPHFLNPLGLQGNPATAAMLIPHLAPGESFRCFEEGEASAEIGVDARVARAFSVSTPRAA